MSESFTKILHMVEAIFSVKLGEEGYFLESINEEVDVGFRADTRGLAEDFYCNLIVMVKMRGMNFEESLWVKCLTSIHVLTIYTRV